MLVTWLVIVPIAREAVTGGTVAALVAVLATLVLLALEMLLTVRWR
jgi:hypothetical protein